MSKWLSVGAATLTAILGGYTTTENNAHDQSIEILALRTEGLATRLREDEARYQDIERELSSRIAELEGQILVLEAKKR